MTTNQKVAGSSLTSGTAQELTADRLYEVYLALLGSRLITLTGTLTGTEYHRITPHHSTTLYISGVARRIPPHHTPVIGLRIRRSQVRVLPSAPAEIPAKCSKTKAPGRVAGAFGSSR